MKPWTAHIGYAPADYCAKWNPNQGTDKLIRRAKRAAQVHSRDYLKPWLNYTQRGGMGDAR